MSPCRRERLLTTWIDGRSRLPAQVDVVVSAYICAHARRDRWRVGGASAGGWSVAEGWAMAYITYIASRQRVHVEQQAEATAHMYYVGVVAESWNN